MKFIAQECTKSWCGRKAWAPFLHRQSNKFFTAILLHRTSATSRLLFPAALYDGLRLAKKAMHQCYTSLLSIGHPFLGSAAGPVRKHRLLKATGPFWRFGCAKGIFAPLPLRSFSTPGCGGPFHWCTGLGNRKAQYWTNVHLSEYKNLCFQLSTVLSKTCLFSSCFSFLCGS